MVGYLEYILLLFVFIFIFLFIPYLLLLILASVYAIIKTRPFALLLFILLYVSALTVYIDVPLLVPLSGVVVSGFLLGRSLAGVFYTPRRKSRLKSFRIGNVDFSSNSGACGSYTCDNIGKNRENVRVWNLVMLVLLLVAITVAVSSLVFGKNMLVLSGVLFAGYISYRAGVKLTGSSRVSGGPAV